MKTFFCVLYFLYRVFSYFEKFLKNQHVRAKEISPKTGRNEKGDPLVYKYEIQRGTLKKTTLRRRVKGRSQQNKHIIILIEFKN